MKTRILALLIFLTLVFSAEAGVNPGTIKPAITEAQIKAYNEAYARYLSDLEKWNKCKCGKKPEAPTYPKCISMEIPFGTPLHQANIPKGSITLEKEKPAQSIFSPQSLKFDFNFDSNIASITTTGLPAGISSEVRVKRASDTTIVYQFKNGESTGYPTGSDIALSIPMRMIDANGNAVTSNPVYYERLFPNGSKLRYLAQQLSYVYSIIDQDGNEYTSSSIGVETVYDANRMLRQIWSAADGLADIVVIDDYKYEIRLYSPENAGSKNGQGLYVPQNSPVELWTVENPNRSATNFNNVRITQTIAGTAYAYDWSYTEGTDAWTVTSGVGLRKASKYYFGDFNTQDCRIIDETRDAANNLVTNKVSNSKVFEWGAAIVDETVDPDGANLRTSYTYYNNPSETGKYGKLNAIQKPDGSWESYNYDSQGRKTLVVSSYLDAALNSPAGSAKAEYYSYAPLDNADILLPNDGRPRTIETKLLGKTVNRKYFVYKNINGEPIDIEEEGLASFGDSSNQRKTTAYYLSSDGEAAKGRIKSIAWSNRKLDTYTYEYGTYSANQDPASSSFSAGTGDALRQTIVRGTTANPSGIAGKSTKETKVTDGRNNDVMAEIYAYDGAGYSRVAWNVNTFDTQHHVLASHNSNGTYSTATWNCCSKDSESTNDGTHYTYSYNLLKQMVSKTKVGGPTTAYTYDVEGRQLSETVSGGGVSLATSATYDLAGRVTSRSDAAGLVTAYAYSNGRRTVTTTLPGGFTEITDHYLDGKIKSVTGTAAVAKYYTYGANQNGTQWIQVNISAANFPNYVKTTTDALGRTISEEKPGVTGTLVKNYIYNAQGLLIKTTSTGNADTLYAYDVFNNLFRTALDLNSNGQIDLSADDRASESETSYQSVNSQWWSVTTSKVYGDNGAVTTNVTKKQLTGLASGTIANTISTDINGNDTVSTTTLNRTNKTVVQTVNTPDSNVDSVSTTVNGLLVSQRTATNLTYNFSYDGIGRKIGDTDPRTGASVTHYNALGQVDYVQDAAGKQTSFTYEANTGRRSSVVNALNKATSYTYNSRGQIVTVRGDASYPLDYVYDSYGRMFQLKTYRSTESISSNPDITTWAYQDSTGLLTSKTYADNKSVSYTYSNEGKLATRTWSRDVVTTYSYNLAGDLTGISYSDSTPSVAFTYNRLGQQLTVTDAVGSRTFGYDNTLRLTSEVITGIYNKTLNRSYDTLGRSSGMNIGTEYAVGYGYDALGRFSTVTNGNDTFTYGYLPNSNLISSIQYPASISVTKSYEANRDLVTSIENKYGTTTISKYDYSNDDLGRRTAMGKSGTAFTQADSIAYGYNDRSEVTSAVAQNQNNFNYGFSFDALGNRITSTTSETGTAVQTSYTANNLNQYSLINDGAQKTPAYDFDGNMTGDGSGWTYTWDGENRLIVAEKTGQRLEFKYDYMSRRVEKRVLDGGSETKKERFVYDRFLQVEKLNALDSNTIEKKSIWSNGQLISEIQGINAYYTVFDANKNATEYLDASGAIQGHYEFSPFGKVTVTSGNNPDVFDFKFSSEYFDTETELVYYNFRYYSPEMGRWLKRDKIGENGGENLYGMVANDSLNWIDMLGNGIWCDKPSDDNSDDDTKILPPPRPKPPVSDPVDLKSKQYDDVYSELAAQCPTCPVTGTVKCCPEECLAEAARIARVYVNTIYSEREKGYTIGGDDGGNKWYNYYRGKSHLCNEWSCITRNAVSPVIVHIDDNVVKKSKCFSLNETFTKKHAYVEIKYIGGDSSQDPTKLDPWHTAYPIAY